MTRVVARAITVADMIDCRFYVSGNGDSDEGGNRVYHQNQGVVGTKDVRTSRRQRRKQMRGKRRQIGRLNSPVLRNERGAFGYCTCAADVRIS